MSFDTSESRGLSQTIRHYNNKQRGERTEKGNRGWRQPVRSPSWNVWVVFPVKQPSFPPFLLLQTCVHSSFFSLLFFLLCSGWKTSSSNRGKTGWCRGFGQRTRPIDCRCESELLKRANQGFASNTQPGAHWSTEEKTVPSKLLQHRDQSCWMSCGSCLTFLKLSTLLCLLTCYYNSWNNTHCMISYSFDHSLSQLFSHQLKFHLSS